MSDLVHDEVIKYLSQPLRAVAAPNDVLSWATLRLMGFDPIPATMRHVFEFPAGDLEVTPIPDINLDGEKLRRLVAESHREADVWDACKFAVARYLLQGRPLPADLAKWNMDVLNGVLPRPTGQGGAASDRKNRNIARNIKIRRAVKLAMNLANLPPYLNWGAETQTACHVVAECLVELHRRNDPGGAVLTYEAVKKIWLSGDGIPTAGSGTEQM